MKKLYIILLSLTILFAYLGCGKSPEPEPLPLVLPEATLIGANTMGAIIDGKVWVNNGEFACYGFKWRCLEVNYSKENSSLLFRASYFKLHEVDINFIFELSNIFGTGTYKLGRYKSFEPYNLVGVHDHDRDKYFETNDFSGGNFTVTQLDTVKKIISGTFEFTAFNRNGNMLDSTVVKDGRFDFNYPDN